MDRKITTLFAAGTTFDRQLLKNVVGCWLENRIKGFSLIELMIVIAIIGILLLVALPSYQTYTRRAHYTEIIQAAAPFKLGVAQCFQTMGELSSCNGGKYGIPSNVTNTSTTQSLVKRIQVKKGIITITPNQKFGILTSDNYILTPSITDNQLLWATSGGGVTHGYAQ